MFNKKTWQIIILLLIVLGVAYYFFNGFYLKSRQKQASKTPQTALDRLFEFKVARQDLSQKQIEKYKKEFDKDVDLILANKDHFDFEAVNDIGRVKKILHDYEGARDAWEFLSLKRPKNSLSFFNLGNLYAEDLKDNQKAEENYLKCLKNSKGESGNEQYYRAVVNFYTYYYPTKKKQIEKILLNGLSQQEYKNNQNLLSLLATYYQNNGQPKKALEYWQKILKLDPGNTAVMEEIEKLK